MGLVTPKISIRAGEMEFWRIANVGADLFLKPKIEGMPFFVLGTDGYWLQRPEKAEEMLMGPVNGEKWWWSAGDPAD
jgi:hypothetical protein